MLDKEADKHEAHKHEAHKHEADKQKLTSMKLTNMKLTNMKLKNMKIFRIITVLSLIISAGSCTKLDEEVFSTITNENYYKTIDEVEAAVSRPYSHLRQTYMFFSTNGGSTYLLQELSTDEAAWPQKGRDGFDNGNWLRLHRHEWTPEDGSFKLAWNHLYKGISFCNTVLHDITPIEFIPEAQKTVYIAEVRGMRSLFYYYLLDLFGNVPIVTATDQYSPASKTRAELYAYIETELTEIRDQLPQYNSGEMYGRFTKQTAEAILSRMYLNAEVYTGTAEWSKCIEVCESIANSGLFQLDAHWQTPFLTNNYLSKENIFVIPNDAVYGNDVDNLFKFTTHWAQKETQFSYTGNGGYNGLVTVREFIEKYDTLNDKRCKFDSHALIAGNQNNPDIQRGQFMWGLQLGIDGDTVRATNDLIGQPLSFTLDVANMTDGKENSGARNIKYRVETGASGFSNDLVVFRLAEIYFNWAEASIRLGGQVPAAALEGINTIRSRAGIPAYTSGELTLIELFDEKGREMAYEAIRRTDMIRFGTYTNARWDKEQSASFRTLYPIPQSSRNVNPNLTQNAGYP